MELDDSNEITNENEIGNEIEIDNNYEILTNNDGISDGDLLNEISDDDDLLNEQLNGTWSSEEEFNETNEDFGDDNGNNMLNEREFDNGVEESDKIVDESLNNQQMPYINGDFAPYFKNITEALMFCWIQKHNICKLILIFSILV